MHTEPIYPYVLRRLAEAKRQRIDQRTIAAGSGVPYSTLTKIVQGRTKNPGIQHVQALYDYFTRLDQGERMAA